MHLFNCFDWEIPYRLVNAHCFDPIHCNKFCSVGPKKIVFYSYFLTVLIFSLVCTVCSVSASNMMLHTQVASWEILSFLIILKKYLKTHTHTNRQLSTNVHPLDWHTHTHDTGHTVDVCTHKYVHMQIRFHTVCAVHTCTNTNTQGCLHRGSGADQVSVNTHILLCIDGQGWHPVQFDSFKWCCDYQRRKEKTQELAVLKEKIIFFEEYADLMQEKVIYKGDIFLNMLHMI